MDGGERYLEAGRLEGLFAASGLLLCVLDREGRIVAASGGWRDALGWSAEALCGRSYADLLHPEDRAGWPAGAAPPEGPVVHRLRAEVGGHRWMEWRAGAPDAGGLVLASLRDVTAERARRALAEEVEAIAGVGTWEIEDGGDTVRWSPITWRIHELEEEGPALPVERALAHYPEEARARLAAALDRLAADGTPFDLELPFVTGRGRARVVRATAAAERREGRLLRVHGTFQDVTERRETEERLRSAEAEARAAREQLESAVEALPDAFALYDAEDRLVLCNRRYHEFYPETAPVLVPGVRFEDMLRYGLERGQYAEAKGREEEWLAERLEAHRRAEGAVEQHLRNGRWVRIVEKPTADGGRVGLRIDVTALKLQEAELRATNAELRTALAERDAAESRFFDIAEISADWFWEQDADLRFTFISRSFERVVGESYADQIGRTREELHAGHPEVWESADWDWLNARLAAREPFSDFVYRARETAEGDTWVRIAGAPVHDSEGNFAGYRGVGSDVSVLYNALRRAEEANQAKSRFLASMSHEIRTPMNGVLGMAEVLEATLTEPAERQMVGAIRESGETLLTIIDDILDFSKIEAGRLELEAVQFRPRDLARRVESLHTLRAAEKNISLSVMTTRGADVPRLGDQHRILQILHNLVSNAIKFTEQGEVAITIRCQPDRPLVVEVRDTGIGMTEEQSRRIFEDFVQADSSTRRRFGGTGLGMAIVRRLVEAMEGRVDLESRPGEGTRVRVALPLEVCAPAAAGAGGGGQAPLPRGLRVLAADDNRTNRLVLEAMLARLGARAEILAGGREAVAAAAEARFDLILLDISMPEMDGLEALEAIRVGERARGEPPTPAVAVTANALTHQVESYMARGFAGHVAKPIRPEALLAAMHGCLAACAGAAAVRS